MIRPSLREAELLELVDAASAATFRALECDRAGELDRVRSGELEDGVIPVAGEELEALELLEDASRTLRRASLLLERAALGRELARARAQLVELERGES